MLSAKPAPLVTGLVVLFFAKLLRFHGGKKPKPTQNEEIYIQFQKGSDHHISTRAGLLLLLYLHASKLPALLSFKSATVSWKGQISNKCQINAGLPGSTVFERPHTTHHKI